ncbi:MAG: hypothetical protein ACE5IK_09810 [Acidobacteriota bacterium]
MSGCTYIVQCWDCCAEFDACAAAWCACSATAPSKMCPYCLGCSCRASRIHVDRFWRDAPPDLIAERESLSGRRVPLGRLLLDQHRVTPEQLGEALEQQSRTGEQLGRCFVDLGILAPSDLDAVLGEHQAPVGFELGDRTLLDPRLAQELGATFCVERRLLPLEQVPIRGSRHVLLAMAEPSDHAAIMHVQNRLNARVIAGRADPAEIEAALARTFPEFFPTVAPESGTPDSSTDTGEQLVRAAAAARATHLRLRHDRDRLHLTWVVDGIVHPAPAGQDPPAGALQSLLAWFEGEPRRRGRRLRVDGVDFLAVPHVADGPQGLIVTVRIFDTREPAAELDFAMLGEDARATIEKAIAAPRGLILLTGGPGAQTERTFWGLVNVASRLQREVQLIDAPLRHPASRVHWTRSEAGGPLVVTTDPGGHCQAPMDLLACYRLTEGDHLHQAVAAARSRVVLVRLDDDRPEAALRSVLQPAGNRRAELTGTPTLVLAQDAVLRICDTCFEPDPDGPARLDAHGFPAPEGAERTTYRGAGCPACGVGAGGRGREPIIELLSYGPDLAAALQAPDASETRRHVIVGRTLDEQLMDMLARGFTTADEVIRVLQERRSFSRRPVRGTRLSALPLR